MLKKYDMNLFYSSIARLSIVCPAAKAVQFSRGFLVKKTGCPVSFLYRHTLFTNISYNEREGKLTRTHFSYKMP